MVLIAGMLSAVHLLNFLNYTFLSDYFNPPLTRSVLLVACGLLLAGSSGANLKYHLRRSWDIYAICIVAVMSAVYSDRPAETLKYSLWLTLTAYVGTELAARVRRAGDVAVALLVVLLPASLLVAAANIAFGPVVVGTGRHFGALGSHHVDTAYAMDFICLFLALKSVSSRTWVAPKWLRVMMLGILVWAVYQVIFGLTRSVWLGTLLAVGVYTFRQTLSPQRLAWLAVVTVAAVVAMSTFDISRLLPEEVKGRLEVTERRYESGEIDPRVEGMRMALRYTLAHPEGQGYAGERSAHNSYLNILIDLGWLGFALSMLTIGRSVLMVVRAGGWLTFFAVGAGAPLMHAFFEVNSLPGQANFVPLLLWYAMSRSRYLAEEGRRP